MGIYECLVFPTVQCWAQGFQRWQEAGVGGCGCRLRGTPGMTGTDTSVPSSPLLLVVEVTLLCLAV